MKTAATLFTSIFCAITLLTMPLFAIDDHQLIELQQTAIRRAVDRVAPCVVQIETLGGLERVNGVLVSSGPSTGLIVDESGYIVSSAFSLMQRPDSILVRLPDGQRHPAEIVARDRSRMTVLLKVDLDQPLPTPTASPRNSWQPGETTIALGRTFDKETVNLSVGILSATNRIWGRAVQTDANVSPANYGGPLIDLQGRVIGVLVPLSPEDNREMAGAELYDSGIGFAVPLVDLLQQLPRWKTGEDLLPGRLGITLDTKDQFDPQPKIGVVKLNSPASKIGLQPGDLITKVNDQPVQRVSELRHALGPLYAGSTVRLTVERGDESLQFEPELIGKIPPYQHPFLGILPTALTSPVDASEFNAKDVSTKAANPGEPSRESQTSDKEDAPRQDTPGIQGVGIRYVFSDSPASKSGLQVGDVIIKLADEAISGEEDLRQQLAQHRPESTVALTVHRRRGEVVETINTTFATLPESIPEQLPTMRLTGLARELETGEQSLTVPEEPNECTVYVPESVQQHPSPGLLVLLWPPDQIRTEELIEDWSDACNQQGIVLMIPQANDAKQWSRSESRYVAKIMDRAITNYQIDEQKTALVGVQAGGAMAYLAGLRHRQLVRAIGVLDAVAPGSLDQIENEPLQRLAFLQARSIDSEVTAQMSGNAETLRQAKFPVTELTTRGQSGRFTSRQRQAIARWVATLDRL